MERLNRKLILEFLEDDVQDVSVDKLNIDTPIQEPIEVKQEEPAPTVELSEQEKVNFVVSTLTELSQRVLDLFNYLTPLINTDMTSFNLSEQNKDLLNSIYEDISLVLGKVQQGIKDNCVDNIQNAIDDGQTQAQETIVDDLKKPIKEEWKGSDREDLISTYINEYFRNYFHESNSKIDKLKQYTYKILNPRNDDYFYGDDREIFDTILYCIDTYDDFFGLIKLFYGSIRKYRQEIISLAEKIYRDLMGFNPQNIKKAQETITPEVDLKEDLNSDKEKLWDDLMTDVDMGDFFDGMQENEDEEKEKFFKDPKKELQNWKDYYKENPEMLDKIKAFEDKYCKE